MPKVSVCIPAYRHGHLIAFTIKSILAQSLQDFELIISDDNSPDNTVEIVENFDDPRIKLIKNHHNNGPAVNLNVAISHASSEYVAIIASDDVMEPTRLAKTLAFLETRPTYSAVFTYVQTINLKHQKIQHRMMKLFNHPLLSRTEILSRFFYRGNFICAPSGMLRKSVIKNLGWFNPTLWQLQDFDMWIKMLTAGHEIGMIEEPLTYYRIGNNLSVIDGQCDSKFLSRTSFEISQVLSHFCTMANREDFSQVFATRPNPYHISELPDLYLAQEVYRGMTQDKSWLLKKHPADILGYYTFASQIFANNLKNYPLMTDTPSGFKMTDFLNFISHHPMIERVNYYECLVGISVSQTQVMAKFRQTDGRRLAHCRSILVRIWHLFKLILGLFK